ncbi:hypothetical protein BDV97DRAFT_40151 [Delphinella strobiligena]|nr:hypothetical protein BDV97DRAFT_40151 [Delphinella strobiligena]
MSDPPPSKRARTDEHVISEQDTQQQCLTDRLTRTLENKAWVDSCRETLKVIPLDTLYSIVIAAAAHDPDVEPSLQRAAIDAERAKLDAEKAEIEAEIAAINAARAAAATHIIDFDHLSKEVWHELNTRYSGLSGSKQYDRAYDALGVVLDCVAEIGEQTPVHASFGTKKSALETLRKMGRSVCLSNSDVVGHEVYQAFGWGRYITPRYHV